jgi:hypothetical protein
MADDFEDDIELAEEEIEIEGDLDVDELEPELDVDGDLEDDDAFGLEEDDAFVAGDDDDFVADEEDNPDDRGPRAVVVVSGEEDDDLELTNEDDIEADLDTILKDRLTAENDEPELDDDEEPEVEDRTIGDERLQPKRVDEQACTRCFMLVRQGAPRCPMDDDDCPIFPG